MDKEREIRHLFEWNKESPKSGIVHDLEETEKQIIRKQGLLENFPNDNFLKVSLSELIKVKKRLELALDTSI